MEWNKSRVKLSVSSVNDPSIRVASVECELAGTLAVHPGICNDAGDTCVTHVRSGLRVAKTEDPEHAKKIVASLNNRCAPALAYDTEDEILDRMPLEAFQWLQECKRLKRWVKPPWEEND